MSALEKKTKAELIELVERLRDENEGLGKSIVKKAGDVGELRALLEDAARELNQLEGRAEDAEENGEYLCKAFAEQAHFFEINHDDAVKAFKQAVSFARCWEQQAHAAIGALTFYANDASYEYQNDIQLTPIEYDRGEVATTALESFQRNLWLGLIETLPLRDLETEERERVRDVLRQKVEWDRQAAQEARSSV